MTGLVRSSKSAPAVLVCFAVREEAAAFRKNLSAFSNVTILVSGMGKRNAEREIRRALQQQKFELVLTCGFAGGLDPKFQIGDVLFEVAEDAALTESLHQAGALPAKFHCAERVAVTVQEKAALRESTKADAVEMESSIIRHICREQKIPSATLRVISDPANEDLPLDFNALMTADQNLSIPRLIAALVKSPGKIPALMQLQRNTAFAAKRLAQVLESLLRTLGNARA